MSTLLSFVIPCYRSEKTIDFVIDEIIQTVGEKEEYDYVAVSIRSRRRLPLKDLEATSI